MTDRKEKDEADDEELSLGDLEQQSSPPGVVSNTDVAVETAATEAANAAVVELLVECFGVVGTLGTCVRHPTCPVVTGLNTTTLPSSSSSSHHHSPLHSDASMVGANAASVVFKVVSCRVCYAEEKSVGIRQYPTFAAVVQQLRLHAGNKFESASNFSLNESFMFQCSMSNLDNHHSQPSSPSQQQQSQLLSSPGSNGGTTKQNPNRHPYSPNTAMATMPPPPHPSNLASRVLHFLQHAPGATESCLKRLNQVQNWILRSKERDVLALQLQMRGLEQRLADSQALNEELKGTVKQLRRTIQQDLKVIKTMATQQFEDEINMASSSHHNSTSSLHHSTSSFHHAASPAKQRLAGVSPLTDGVSTVLATATANSSSSTNTVTRFSPIKRTMSTQSSHNIDASIPIPEDDEQDLEAAEQPEALLSSTSSHHTTSGLGSSSTHRQYWSNNEALKSSRIFQSFRGGLLDIPKSPPAARHDRDGDNNGKPTTRQKLQLNMAAMDALQLPTRALSRSNSNVVAPNQQYPTHHLNKQLAQNSNHLTPTPTNPSGTEIPLDILTAKLSQQPYVPHIHGQSPEQVDGDTAAVATTTSTTIATSADLPVAPLTTTTTIPDIGVSTPNNKCAPPTQSSEQTRVDDDDDDDGNDGGSTVMDSNGLLSSGGVGGESDKFIFSVTGASCQDKFGDEGTYTGQILVTEGLPHGVGKMDYESGRIYEGDWVSGQWHGKGKLLNPNGDSYDGEFFFDARHGQGVYRWDNGDVYIGSFSSDKRHGKGKFSFHNGNVYSGEFCDGMFEGFGRYEFAGGYYEGDWKEGRYDGAGELMYATGGKYTGEFRNSVAHGFGLEVMPDGRKRRGVWVDGKPTEYFERD